MLKSLYIFAVACLLPVSLAAQSQPSAEGPPILLWVGASFSTFNPDYGCGSASPFTCWNGQVVGISPYAHTAPILFNRIGAEGQARFLLWHGPNGLTESTYMAGPRIRIASFGAMSLNARFLFGVGRLHVPVNQFGAGTYFAYAPGGTLDYRMSKRVAARVDYEYQRWPSFGGLNGNHGLTPNGLSFGFSYAIP